ncbi:tRNA (cytosine(72)-C(5))-methyltransferase NSUN6 isoform X2 [Atheta coriaria]
MPKIYKHSTLDMLVIEHLDEKYLDLEKVSKEVVIDHKCAAAVLRGAHIFAPGVIGMTKNCNIDDKVSVYVDTSPTNKCKKGFAKVFDSEYKHFIANGRVKLTRSDLFCLEPIETGIAIEITDTISGCPPLDHNVLHHHGAMLQNLPSIVAVECLNVEKHSRILDMCASPGGKTVHISAKISPECFLMACDKTPHKILQLKRTSEKYNIENIRIECVDWVKTNNKMAASIADVLVEKFDAILLDAPCSASGNRPQLLNTDSEVILASFVAVQKNLIRTAVDMLRPGGTLVYSTCSIAVPENEGIVSYALKKLPLELIPAEPKHGSHGLPYEGIEHSEYLQRFGPDVMEHNSIGFFIAKFKKTKIEP